MSRTQAFKTLARAQLNVAHRRHPTAVIRHVRQRSFYSSSSSSADQPSGATLFYRQMVPSMIAVLAISSTVYYGLELLHSVLDRQLYVQEMSKKVNELEMKLDQLKKATDTTTTAQMGKQAEKRPWWKWW
ncbi:hypothetical protein OIO90_001428 [Microbotryomycetes sp. JL221]|nr:hypothetical protein OIO90_001428 [Microbotryomycetes sp. JL221]